MKKKERGQPLSRRKAGIPPWAGKCEKIILNITGMHCVSCAKTIETALKKAQGINSAQVNFASEKAYIEFDQDKISSGALISLVEKAGYKAYLADGASDREKELRDKEVRGLKSRFILALILSSILMYVCMGHCLGLTIPRVIVENMALTQLLLASAVLICGFQFFKGGFLAVVRGRSANMDTLVALGVGSAYLYSLAVSIRNWVGGSLSCGGQLYYEVAAFVLTFIMLGKYLEALTKRKTSQAIRRLWSFRPDKVVVLREQSEIEISLEELSVGEIVVIKPGGRVPVDGKVIEGSSSVDESIITGESIPVEKNIGDTVIAGSINKSGTFKFKAVRVGKETTLAKIIKLVEEAQSSKAPVQELADKIAAYFVPAVLLIALASFSIWFLLGKGFLFALTVFITVLIIACPCTLGLAVPTAVIAATAKAAQNGIIIKDAASLQLAREIKVVAFDKTGTLTIGKPAVTDIISYISDDKEVLRLAGSLEKASEHILAEAVLNSARSQGVSLAEVKNFESIPGKGVRGLIDGRQALLGNLRLMEENKIDLQKAQADLARLESEGKTVMCIAKDNQLSGLIAVRDSLKEFSRAVVDKLKSMGKEVIMITGDNRRTAQVIAKELGIAKVLAEVLPQDKQDEIKKLQARGLKTAFVGDGINDAPAITQADLGIAIGSGIDVALEAGDIILIKDDLRDVVMAIDLSHYAMKKIKQNLFFAFFYNSLGIPIAAGILYPFFGFLLNPMIAGAAMTCSSLSVVTNSLLMRRYKRNI